jgi:glc operon protein GlcG
MSCGPAITLETAKKAAAAAIAEVRRNNWTMAVAVVDTAGDLVYFEKMDDTQVASVLVCQDKARSAARFKRPTKAFQDMLTAGGEGMRVLRLKGAVPVEGGLPITIEGTSSARSVCQAARVLRTVNAPSRASMRSVNGAIFVTSV